MSLISTKLPIDISILKDYFSLEDKPSFVTQYTENEFDDNPIIVLNYIKNIGLDIHILFENTSMDKRYELLSAYLKFPSLVNTKSLEMALTYLLLVSNEKEAKEVEEFSILNKEYTDKFIKEHKKELNAITNFIRSLPATMLKFAPDFEEEWEIAKNKLILNREENAIAINGINTLRNPFIYDLLIINNYDATYYSHYMEEDLYEGSNIFKFLVDINCPLIVYLSCILSPEVPIEDVIPV